MTRITRLTGVLATPVLAACGDILRPVAREVGTRRHGDFIAAVDSIAVSPDTVRHGDTVSVRLFSSVNGGCFAWTAIFSRTGYRVSFTIWGRNGTPAVCHPLDGEARFRFAAEPGPWGDFTVSVTQPSGPPLIRCVPIHAATRPVPPRGITRPRVAMECP